MIIQEQEGNPGRNPHSGQSFFDDPEKMAGDVATPTPPPTPVSTPVQQQPNRSAKDILNEMYSYQAPKPTYDPNRPEEIKRMARVNAIGEGMKTLGDFIALGAGANVTRREPDRTNPQLLQTLWQNIDKANAQKDNWNWQNYLAKIRNSQAELGQANRDADIARQEKNRGEDIARQGAWRKEDQQYRDDRNKIEDERYNENLDRETAWREGGGEYKNWEKKTDHQYALEMQKLDKRLAAEMAKYAAKSGFNGKNFTLFDDSGQAVKTLAPGELEKVTQMILKDPAVAESASKDIGLMKAQFGEGLSKQALQTIIAYYWDKSPVVKQYLNGGHQPASPQGNPFYNPIPTIPQSIESTSPQRQGTGGFY